MGAIGANGNPGEVIGQPPAVEFRIFAGVNFQGYRFAAA